MKIYRNSILSLKISSCEECPHKKAQRYRKIKGFSTHYVCSAINRMRILKIEGQNPLGSYHPFISEARFNGAFLPDCPLEDV